MSKSIKRRVVRQHYHRAALAAIGLMRNRRQFSGWWWCDAVVNPHPSVHQQEVQLWNYSSNRVNWIWKNIITRWKMWPQFRIPIRDQRPEIVAEEEGSGVRRMRARYINQQSHSSLWFTDEFLKEIFIFNCLFLCFFCVATNCSAFLYRLPPSPPVPAEAFTPTYRPTDGMHAMPVPSIYGWVSAHIQNEILYSWWAQSLVSLLLMMEQHTTRAIILTCWSFVKSVGWAPIFAWWQFY